MYPTWYQGKPAAGLGFRLRKALVQRRRIRTALLVAQAWKMDFDPGLDVRKKPTVATEELNVTVIAYSISAR